MKEQILQILATAGDGFVSGEELSGVLGVSRTAVWKHVAELRRLGYDIEARSRCGYRLERLPDRLDPVQVRLGLQTRAFGHQAHYLPSCGSTNEIAKELAAAGAVEGTLVVTEEQVAGKGRLGRAWMAPLGSSILMSVLLRPALLPAQVPSLSLAAAVAVATAVERVTGASLGLKWPNDLFLEGRKAGGILVELAAETDTVHYAVVGLGLNVNVPPGYWPAGLADTAASLAAFLGRTLDRVAILRAVLEELEAVYLDWQAGGFAAVRQEWVNRSVTLGHQISVTMPGGTLQGTAEDVDLEGRLLLRLADGSTVPLAAGEVTLRETKKTG